jgi:hypothetical protein
MGDLYHVCMRLFGKSQTGIGRRDKPRMDANLAAEIAQSPPWMYAWELEDGVTTPVGHPELPEIHQTRLD